MSAEGATRDRTGDETDGERRRTSNARRKGKPDGRTGASGEQPATAGKWHGRGRNVGRTARDETGKRYGRERNIERVARDGRKTGIAREGDGKPQASRREDLC